MTSPGRYPSISTEWHRPATALQEELALLLDRYASALETGREQDAEELLAQHPELTRHLGSHLESLQLLCRATRSVSLGRAEVEAATAAQESDLGDYRIEREIGRGGMGIVYAAKQLSLGRSVALKVLPFASVLDQQQVARFRNEAQAAASLHHPHIVPVYGVGCERGVHYYSMQLIDGQSLEQAIDELRGREVGGSLARPENETVTFRPDNGSTSPRSLHPLSTAVSVRNKNFVKASVELMIRVAEALDYAHGQGVVHRDIKPSNLLLDANGKIWITDFGLARWQGGSSLTVNGDLLGTARYMSPEQIAGRPQEIDYRSDIYSLGVTLYELLTLQYAHDGASRELLLRSIESREPNSPRRLNPAISVDLETIIGKAMSKRKEDRYVTAEEFANDLRRYLDGKPTLARRPSLADRILRIAARRKRWVAVSFVGLGLFGIAATSAAFMIGQQKELQEQTAARAKLHLRQAHEVVQRFGGLLSDELALVPGADPVRAELLAEATQYYRDFIEYAADDEELRAELAHVHFQLGSVYERLGNLRQSETEYQTSIELYQQLLKQQPTDAGIRSDIALVYNNLGVLRNSLGQTKLAYDDYTMALELQRQLVIEAPDAPMMVRRLAMTQANLGLLCWAMGNPKLAATHFHDAMAGLDRCRESQSDDPQFCQQRSECRNNWVALLSDTDPVEAEQVLRTALAEMQQASQDDERLQQATLQNNLVPLLLARGATNEAAELSRGAVTTLQNRFDAGSADFRVREQLAVARNNWGRVLASQGDSAGSEEQLLLAEGILRRELKNAPQRPELLSRLGGVLHNRGILAEQANELDDAVNHLTAALENQALAIKLAPMSREYRQFLDAHRQHLDHVLQSLQRN